MAGYKLIGKNKLIPRKTFQGRHRQFSKSDPSSPFENKEVEVVYTDFEVLECVVQPIEGKANKDLTDQLTSEGGREYDSYTVYSSTPLLGLVEGTSILSDQILLPDSRGGMSWFTVLKTDPYPTSGVARYRAYVVAVPEGEAGGI